MSQIIKPATAGSLPPTVFETITGNDGVPEAAINHNFNILTANATPQFKGSAGTETLNFGLTNLLIGDPGANITSAASNVGYGIGALTALSLGSFNAAFGLTALSKCTSGDFDTAIGCNSLSALTSGQFATAVGYAALTSATLGGSTAVGAGALQFLTTGIQNCAIGFQSLNQSNTSNNVAIGFDSLALSSTGSGQNTAIGSSTATSLLTGANNIFIGFAAGTNYTGAESSNIIIKNAGVLAESNVIRIGTQGSGAGQQNTCYVAGINGVTVSNAQFVTINSSTGQLGVTGSQAPLVTQYTTAGTYYWTPKAATTVVEFYVWGGGGGGGSGRCGASTAAGGGAGGNCGYFVYSKTLASLLTSAPYTVTVAASVAGGLSVNAVTTNGNPGTAGNPSSVGSVVIAPGGALGGGGTTTISTTQSSLGSFSWNNQTVNGAQGSNTTSASPSQLTYPTWATPGASAGGYNSGAAHAGSASPNIQDLAGNILVMGGSAGSASGGSAAANAGGNGVSNSGVSILIGGTGGGSGGQDTTGTNAGKGGDGAAPGGGGGGGAGALNSNPSGAGGAGAAGAVIIIEYF